MRDVTKKIDISKIIPNDLTMSLSYSYRSTYGVYNPLWGEFEPNGPSLNELVYRELTSVGQTICDSDYNVSMYAAECFFAVPHFLEGINKEVLPLILQAPIFPVYDSYPKLTDYQTNPIVNYPVTTFQIEPMDLVMVFQMPWPENLLDRLVKYPILMKHVRLTLALLYTISKVVSIDPKNPLNLLIYLFGKQNYQIRGISKYEMLENTIIVYKRQTVEESVVVSNGSTSAPIGTESFLATLRSKLDAARNKMNLKEKLENQMVDENISIELETKPVTGTMVDPTSVDLKSIFEKISIKEFDNISNDICTENLTFMKCALLLVSWFVRMGDEHALTKHPYFELIKRDRTLIYAEIVDFCNNISLLSNVCDIKTLAAMFGNFMATHKITLDENLYLIKNRNKEMKKWFGGPLIPTRPNREKCEMIHLAISYILKSGGFKHDYFIEISKIIAYLEYLGNPQRLAYNFYGESSSGKSFLCEILSAVFKSKFSNMLSSRMFSEGNKPTDNDTNAITLGQNFICTLNEDEMLVVEIFKKYVDFNKLMTRDMKKDFCSVHPIRAKIFFTSNSAIRKSHTLLIERCAIHLNLWNKPRRLSWPVKL
ncbi:unnamed protein product [Euphydryas editha]|uniref:SF3 helicase domain-containing protein n=1 Tax=Euphydryas editha TaxID=104508 RepID=A0AAU9TSN4_EUPED|nr:unnamed protein product [Euphydryas editha]